MKKLLFTLFVWTFLNRIAATPTQPPVNSPAAPMPQLAVNSPNLTGFSQRLGTPSTSRDFTVSGTDLTDTLTITAPAGFELSPNGTAWGTAVRLVPVNGRIGTTTLSVRLHATAPGPFSGTISTGCTGTQTISIDVSGTARTVPLVQVDVPAPAPFRQQAGTPSPDQTFSVQGMYLEEDNVWARAPRGYELSSDNGRSWSNALLLPAANGTLPATTIGVRLNADNPGTYNGAVTLSAAGAAPVEVAVGGKAEPARIPSSYGIRRPGGPSPS
ncbi:hypothetical protein V9K67_17925 [Paraflavisolibacter sp. H34]|uniref:hypothetical protein n=1 Tax=Huijunlia imazamoxiresistens TaxID=3127457 RepID=UPI003017165A